MQHKIVAPPTGQATGSEQVSRYHLPVPLTPLVGRELEVAKVCALLQRPTMRLLTLVGTGGVGKTRLGLAVAEELLDDFAEGACFVPLAPVSEYARVIPALAQMLGLWEAGDRPLEEQVQTYLRERHLLLLLDNFEHVIEAAPQFAMLLTACPHLRILVTSLLLSTFPESRRLPAPSCHSSGEGDLSFSAGFFPGSWFLEWLLTPSCLRTRLIWLILTLTSNRS